MDRPEIIQGRRFGAAELADVQQVSPHRRRSQPRSAPRSGLNNQPLRGSWTDLRPLTLVELSQSAAAERAEFAGWLQAYHYLGHRTLVGENLQYLVRERGADR